MSDVFYMEELEPKGKDLTVDLMNDISSLMKEHSSSACSCKRQASRDVTNKESVATCNCKSECGKKNGYAKLSNSRGEPAEGDDPGERDWNQDEDEDEDEDDSDNYIDLENMEYISGLEPIYKCVSEYDRCDRFEPPDRRCTNPPNNRIVSDVRQRCKKNNINVFGSQKISKENNQKGFAKISRRDGAGNVETYDNLSDVYYERWRAGIETETILRSNVMCGAVDSKGQCFTGVPSSCLPPCIKVQTLDDFYRQDLSIAKSDIKFKWTRDSQVGMDNPIAVNVVMEELIISAISLLRYHLDIIEWSVCRLSTSDFDGNRKSPENWFKCLKEVIEEEKIIIKAKGEGTFMVPNYVVPERPVIEIKTTSPSEMFDYYNIYLLSKEYHLTSNPLEDRALVIVDLAATLLHELAHVCGRAVRGAHGDTPNNPGGGACAESYRIENMFRWAMFTRYPDIQISQCRPRVNNTFVNVNDFWGSSETNYPSNWCL